MATHVLTSWNPEDRAFWEREGKAIARRNLWISIPALFLAFAVWMVWSMVVVNLPNVGFRFSENQLFWLAAAPGLSGATLRIFYSFMVPIFGGRKWTTLSTADVSAVFLILALLCGFGGGNFSSSMANISFFFPKAEKGTALGLNAGLGNLGVSAMQFLVPLVITAGVFGALGGEPQTWVKGGATRDMWLQNAGFIWVPFIALATLAAWFGMHDIASAKASFAEQAVIFKRRHTWIMSWLYLGTFGSFIGFSAGLPLLTKYQFPDVDPTQYAFLGPLIGALSRPLGGWVADKVGGARVTFWTFIVMALAVLGVLYFLRGEAHGGVFWGFMAMFLLLFFSTGIGNGSTFRMIPVICSTMFRRETEARGTALSEEALRKEAGMLSAALLGFSSAVGAYGAFFIPKAFGTSIAMTGGPQAALYTFLLFYVTCIAVSWWYYARRGAEVPS
ncbi:MFS transporter [Thermithiobacillus tepidarius]|uniref:MFS transporter n=1 Tax=Thermithiobacillus tepidarius TaxID=929 RepID=UPI00040D6111|nr:MFS transporter [Thermithiobacillus tepidarius]